MKKKLFAKLEVEWENNGGQTTRRLLLVGHHGYVFAEYWNTYDGRWFWQTAFSPNGALDTEVKTEEEAKKACEKSLGVV
jgi:hypothetical protein